MIETILNVTGKGHVYMMNYILYEAVLSIIHLNSCRLPLISLCPLLLHA